MNAQLTGAAGVFYVASELSMRGMVALPSIRNVKGADILVAGPDGKRFAFLQVKTSKSKTTFWLVGKDALKLQGRDYYYVFVRRANSRFEAFLEKAAVVAREVAAADQISRERGCKEFSSAWAITGVYATKGAEERTCRQWERFTLATEHTYKKNPYPPKG